VWWGGVTGGEGLRESALRCNIGPDENSQKTARNSKLFCLAVYIYRLHPVQWQHRSTIITTEALRTLDPTQLWLIWAFYE
jgi:hypothetical protein